MKFTALPVSVGDSFLLEDDGKVILVDGGQKASHILQLLHNKVKNNHIDVCVCTHYDSDHYAGIAAVAKSGTYTIGEIWLPEIVGSIAYTIIDWIRKDLEQVRLEYNPENLGLFNHNVNTKEQVFEKATVSEESVENNFVGTAEVEPYEFRSEEAHSGRFIEKIIYQMNHLPSVVTNLYQSGARIRWLDYVPRYKEIQFNPNINLFGINCIETDLTTHKSSRSLAFALYLSIINKHSLNFKYHRSGVPDVLYTADSDLGYNTTRKIHVKGDSIITAPHHGAASASAAYSRIKLDDNPYFVRSDTAYKKRPCAEYKSQKNKYCTICQDKTNKQEVKFVYDGLKARFDIFGNACICT